MRRRFEPAFDASRLAFGPGDLIIVLLLVALLYLGARLALNAPTEIAGPTVSLSPTVLPWYALLSVSRMAAAYCLSLLFMLVYAYTAARHHTAERVLLPLLDVLQSVPILSFLPIVLLSLTALLPQGIAIELASIVLITTSQVWNMTFSFYQSLTTIPRELHEASDIFQLNPWLRFKTMELPFAMLPLIWNSMMSWSGGWFFLMAAEIFTVGSRDFRLPGLGSYLQTAAATANVPAILAGLGTLILVIVALDQLAWQPLLVWANKFKLEMTEGDSAPESWFFDLLSRSWLVDQIGTRLWHPTTERVDRIVGRLLRPATPPAAPSNGQPSAIAIAGGVVVVAILLYFGSRAFVMLSILPPGDWVRIGVGTFATLARVLISVAIALAWTLPLGVAIGTNRKVEKVMRPVVQVVASLPATALFPIILMLLVHVAGGLDIAAVLLMLMGTQWYLLFNIIAGASAIPQDLSYTTELLRLSRWDRWRTLILPALFPYLITGIVTASGGAWNASIVAEHVEFGGRTLSTNGVGALIAEATARGDYALLLASTLALIVTVVSINRLVWRRLYATAEDKYRLE